MCFGIRSDSWYIVYDSVIGVVCRRVKFRRFESCVASITVLIRCKLQFVLLLLAEVVFVMCQISRLI